MKRILQTASDTKATARKQKQPCTMQATEVRTVNNNSTNDINPSSSHSLKHDKRHRMCCFTMSHNSEVFHMPDATCQIAFTQ